MHDAVVFVKRSEVRQRRFRIIVKKECPKEVQHLRLVKGIKIRWNSQLGESKRASLLRSVCSFVDSVNILLMIHNVQGLDSFIKNLPDGLSGKARAAAKRKQKKLQMWDDDWEYIDALNLGLEVMISHMS